METTIVTVDEKSRATLRGARQGRRYLVLRDGEEFWAKPAPEGLESVAADTWDRRGPAREPAGPDWDEVLKEVRARSRQIATAARRPNPVIAARQKRKFNARLR